MKGIDVSEWQGNIDFDKLKTTDVKFIIPRCGYGQKTTDKEFLSNCKKAENTNGVIAVPAVYHFSYALNEAQARAEADLAVELVKKAGLGKNTVLFFDLEYDSVKYAEKYGVKIDRDKCTAFTEAFCSRVKALGFVPGIYTNIDYINNMHTDEILKKYPLWIADWIVKKPNYNHELASKYTIFAWQYSSHGRVNGINGDVDLNEWYSDAYNGYTDDTPKAKPEPKKTNDEIADEVVKGLWGNGDERKKRLTEAGYDYGNIQTIVNIKMEQQKPKPILKPIATIADEVIAGKWGNGDERKKRLAEAGYDYNSVQTVVNAKLYTAPTTPKSVSPAKSRDDSIAGSYVTTASVNCRYSPGVMIESNVQVIVPNNARVMNYGYYTDTNGERWYLIKYNSYTGYINSKYLKRV